MPGLFVFHSDESKLAGPLRGQVGYQDLRGVRWDLSTTVYRPGTLEVLNWFLLVTRTFLRVSSAESVVSHHCINVGFLQNRFYIIFEISQIPIFFPSESAAP